MSVIQNGLCGDRVTPPVDGIKTVRLQLVPRFGKSGRVSVRFDFCRLPWSPSFAVAGLLSITH